MNIVKLYGRPKVFDNPALQHPSFPCSAFDQIRVAAISEISSEGSAPGLIIREVTKAAVIASWLLGAVQKSPRTGPGQKLHSELGTVGLPCYKLTKTHGQHLVTKVNMDSENRPERKATFQDSFQGFNLAWQRSEVIV